MKHGFSRFSYSVSERIFGDLSAPSKEALCLFRKLPRGGSLPRFQWDDWVLTQSILWIKRLDLLWCVRKEVLLDLPFSVEGYEF